MYFSIWVFSSSKFLYRTSWFMKKYCFSFLSFWICWAVDKHLGSQIYNFWGRETLEISALQVRVHLEIMQLAPGHTGHLWKSSKFKSGALNSLLYFNHVGFLEALHSGVLQLSLLLACIAIILIPLLVVFQYVSTTLLCLVLHTASGIGMQCCSY